MQETGSSDYEDAARWLLTQSHPELIDQWLTPEQAETLRTGLTSDASQSGGALDWLFEFPAVLPLDTSAIDGAVRSFAVWADGVLNAIRGALGGLVSAINFLLSHIPWPILVLLVGVLGWRAKGKVRSGILYGGLFALIGAVGYWSMMELTLSIVLASVLIALVIGPARGRSPFRLRPGQPDYAARFWTPCRPCRCLSTSFPPCCCSAQGNASAVIATVIYAVVPVIRSDQPRHPAGG